MRKHTIAAAIAAAALFGLSATADTATAQNVVDVSAPAVDPSAVHPGADSLILRAPMPAAGAEYATPQIPDDGEVSIPYGDWVSSILAWALGIVGVIAAWVLRRVPVGIVAALDAFAGMLGQGRASEFLEKAISYGINVTAGAVKGKTLKVQVGMEVMERALEYAVRHAPTFVAWLGGAVAVREMIIARLDLEPDATLPSPKPPAEMLVVDDA